MDMRLVVCDQGVKSNSQSLRGGSGEILRSDAADDDVDQKGTMETPVEEGEVLFIRHEWNLSGIQALS